MPHPSITNHNHPTLKTLWRPITLLLLVTVVLVLSHFLKFDRQLLNLRHWIIQSGHWGYLIYLAVYIIATIAAIPGSTLTAFGGILFGSVRGIIAVSISATISASLAFLIARYFAREAVAQRFAHNDKYRKIDKISKEKGGIVVALTRLIPLFPYNFLNYALGLTGVPFWTYVFWTWLCMLPAIIFIVVGTDSLTKGILEGQIPWLLISVFAATGIIVWLLIRYARREYKKYQAMEDGRR